MDETSSKIKKHKRKHRDDVEKEEKMEFGKNDNETVDSENFDSMNKKKKAKKEKKKKSRQRESDGEIGKNKSTIENERDIIKGESNKRKVSDIENGYEEASDKKRKRKHYEGENQNDVSEITDTQDADVSEKIKKKKSKKKKIKLDIDIEKEGNIEDAEAFKPSGEHSQESLEIIDGKEKKKHKKKKKHLNEPEGVEEIAEVTEGTDETSYTKKKKKKKDKKKDRDTDKKQEEIVKSDEKKESTPEEKVEIINKISTESTKQKNDKKSQGIYGCEKAMENEDVKTGQWSSVELGDSERQSKFYRLLGGFKKGSDASQIQNKFSLGKKPVFSPTINSQKKAGGNFAMNKSQENIYTKALENEYERAMSMNLNRGVGLGFEKPPEEGKKFYIDTKSSKSLKFDD